MTIQVFGKKGCGICDAAKDKLRKMGLPFTESDLMGKIIPHKGWRTDGTVEVMAAYTMLNQGMPVIVIDGEAFSYPGAMRKLKRKNDVETPS